VCHLPLALPSIVMLGANDLKHYLNILAPELGRGLACLMKIGWKSECGIDGSPPKVLMVFPSVFGNDSDLMAHHFDGGSHDRAIFPGWAGRSAPIWVAMISIPMPWFRLVPMASNWPLIISGSWPAWRATTGVDRMP